MSMLNKEVEEFRLSAPCISPRVAELAMEDGQGGDAGRARDAGRGRKPLQELVKIATEEKCSQANKKNRAAPADTTVVNFGKFRWVDARSYLIRLEHPGNEGKPQRAAGVGEVGEGGDREARGGEGRLLQDQGGPWQL